MPVNIPIKSIKDLTTIEEYLATDKNLSALVRINNIHVCCEYCNIPYIFRLYIVEPWEAEIKLEKSTISFVVYSRTKLQRNLVSWDKEKKNVHFCNVYPANLSTPRRNVLCMYVNFN